MLPAEVVVAVAEAEGQDVPVRVVVDERRVGEEEVPLVAVEVRRRHEELEEVAARHERLEPGRGRAAVVHVAERPVDPLRHLVALERRLAERPGEEPGGLHDRRHPARAAEQPLDVAPGEPEVAQRVLRLVPRDALREVDAVDAAGGRPRHDVHDDPRAHAPRVALGDGAEQLAPDRLARGLAA